MNRLKHFVSIGFLFFVMFSSHHLSGRGFFPLKDKGVDVGRGYGCCSMLSEEQGSVISYDHDCYVMTSKRGEKFPSEVEALANSVYGAISQAHLFQPSIIKYPLKVRDYVSSTRDEKNKAEKISVRTRDGVLVPCLYFNRNSDKLIIVGSGFTNPKELMAQFAVIYGDCDLVVFDCRGQSYEKMRFNDCSSWSFNLGKALFEIDAPKISFGVKEHQEVYAVINHFKKMHKERYNVPYQAVYGLGICYSALIFLKTLAKHPDEKLFDKVILDGCWLSLFDFIGKLKEDPALLISPQEGGVKDHWFFKKQWVKESLVFLAQHVFGLPIGENVSIEEDLAKLPPIPYLFIYGKDDLVVGRETFEALWNGVKSPGKAAIITSEPHVRNHRYRPGRYKLMTELFFETDSICDWFSLVTSKEKVKEYFVEKIKQL